MHIHSYVTGMCSKCPLHLRDHIARLGEIKEKSKKGLLSRNLGHDTVGDIFDRRRVG